MPTYSSSFKSKAIKLRQKGNSVNDISKTLHIAKSTASVWVKGTQLAKEITSALRNKSKIGLAAALLKKKKLKEQRMQKFATEASTLMKDINVNPATYKLACALLFWAEGQKKLSQLSFVNSDPAMIKTFITALRRAYELDESKFRITLHLHQYHNIKESLHFWSCITNIPLDKFTKPYVKSNTMWKKRKDYNGCIRLTYYDNNIAKELSHLYNAFVNKVIGA